MKKKKSIGLVLISTSLVFAILACNFVTGALDPTAPPPPTAIPAPTNTPLPPIEEQVEEPEDAQPEVDQDVEQQPTEGYASIAEGELGVIVVKAYQDEWDSWIVVGLVENNTDRAVDNIEIEVEAFDINGNSLYTEVAYGSLYSVASGEVTPFRLWVWEDFPNAQEFTADIVGFSSTELERAAVDLIGVQMTFGESDVYVTGELVNNNEFPLEISDVAFATFDMDGSLITAGADDVSVNYLLPGESGPFRASMDLPGSGAEDIDDYKIYTNVEVGAETDIYSITFLEENGYYDSDGDLHLVGSLQNDSDEYLNISLIAAFYDTAGNVLDASYVDIPLYSLAPGELSYYDFYSWYPLNESEGLADQAETYVIQVDYGWTWDTDTVYQDIPYTDNGYEYDSFWGLTFTGQVTNDTGAILDGGKVMVVLHNIETGELIAMGYETLFDEIPEGGSLDYEVLVEIADDLNMDSFEYTVVAKGELP